VVAPAHDGLRGDNVITLLGSLNPVDDAWLAQGRLAFPAPGALPRPRVALLVGGPTRNTPYDVGTLRGWIECVQAVVAREGGSLLVCGSRRTPAAMQALLRNARSPGLPGVQWLDQADGANPYPGVLAWADRIACTPDSVNMLSEACATWAPVFVADPARVQGRTRGFVDALLALGRVRPLDAAMARFEPAPLRETVRVAAAVAARLELPAPR
jgi:mitochondrial fission protein ELM1